MTIRPATRPATIAPTTARMEMTIARSVSNQKADRLDLRSTCDRPPGSTRNVKNSIPRGRKPIGWSPMSHKTSLRVWEHSQTQRAARCLMLALADFANDDGICWPGTALLSKKINESPDYTDVIIKKCIDMGELAKHAGSGRGHPSRFAILCGLSPDAQNKLKGVLQKGYSSTPIPKRGTAKGVLIADKRGTFSDAKHHTNGASGTAIPPISENEILHDPDHGSDSDSARIVLRNCGMYNGTIRQVLALGMDPPTLIASVKNLVAAGWGAGAIANELRDNPPAKGIPYDKPESERPERPDHAPDQRRGSRQRPRGSHNPTGGQELHNPGWQQKELDRIQKLYNIDPAEM